MALLPGHANQGQVSERSLSPTLDQEARFRLAFDANYELTYRFVRRLGLQKSAAEDAVQEVFVVFAQRLRDVVQGKERAFLLSVARKKAAEARRAQSRTNQVDLDAADERPDSKPNPEQSLTKRKREALLDEILDTMNDDVREAFVLFEIEGLSKAEVATALGIPEGTAASRLRRGREHFLEVAQRIKARLTFPTGGGA